jgi:hypothetical protein
MIDVEVEQAAQGLERHVAQTNATSTNNNGVSIFVRIVAGGGDDGLAQDR